MESSTLIYAARPQNSTLKGNPRLQTAWLKRLRPEEFPYFDVIYNESLRAIFRNAPIFFSRLPDLDNIQFSL